MKYSSKSTLSLAILAVLIILFVISVPVSAKDEIQMTPFLQMPELDQQTIEHAAESYRPGTVTDVSKYLEAISDELNLNLSPNEIKQYSITLVSRYLPATGKISPNSSIDVNNYRDFQHDVIDILGLNLVKRNSYLQLTSQCESICATVEVMKHIDGEASSNSKSDDPSEQSAPYAYGKLIYLYVFVSFQGDVVTYWTEDDRATAFGDAQLGTAVISNRAPTCADIEQEFWYNTVTVSGNGDSRNADAWGSSGWMEEAAINMGFSSLNAMIESMKNYTNADSVVVVYCIHNKGRAYAVPPSYGYADRCVVYFWKDVDGEYIFRSDKHVYAHETLHLYGALDEYPNASHHNDTSHMAVNPLNEWYTNTNHHYSPNHQHSIMCAEGLYDVANPVISQSTRNFIGWGDYDGDGIIDALEIRAGTA